MRLSDRDCLGAGGCVASAVMMYAHLPWLLACSLTSETVGGRGGAGKEGGGGGRVVVVVRRGKRREGRRLEGQCWGEGKRKQKS